MTLNKSKSRISSIDLLRGIVMVIMAIDHCRDMIHSGSLLDQDPLDLNTTTPLLFFTRWITNFCAPIFVFLSGTSVFLYGSRGRTKKQVAFFLLTRGIFLMLLEILVIGPLWDFTVDRFYLQVIWTIGLSMVFLAGIQFLSLRIIFSIGLIFVLFHNFLDKIIVEGPPALSLTWSLIHVEHTYKLSEHFQLAVHYPFLPWLGLMILGYCLGRLYLPNTPSGTRKRFLFVAGVTATLLFVLLRWSNLYGDPRPWSQQKSFLFTVFDFINTLKYPPSLLFSLMTIGPGLIFLSMTEELNSRLSRFFVVFGKTPLFYYILHVGLIHIFSWIVFFMAGHHWNELDFSNYRDANIPYGGGSPLWVVYLVWIIVILILYFPCRWYGKYKATHTEWWLSYI